MTQPQSIDEINAALAALSSQIYPLESGLRLIYVGVDDVREQDLNAQSMSKAMFDQLVDNIKTSGAPESVPLLVREGERIEIISGHHRIRAARAAGVKHLLALMYESLSRARIHAKQLAHNSISGVSDPQIVKAIWERIDDVQARFEAFIDPKMFDDIPAPVSFKPVDVDMVSTAKTVLIAFLPTQKADFDAVLEQIMPKTQVDAVYLADREVWDGWIAAFKRVRDDMDIVNTPTALAVMAELALERLDQMKDDDAETEPAGA
ncbi:MAG: hypothetical protein OHK0046_47310 [Anaerolineae bacterium]